MPSDDTEFLKKYHLTVPGAGPEPRAGEKGATAPAAMAASDDDSDPNFASGVGQGLLGFVEAPAYYAEKGIRQVDPSFRLPLHEWARKHRDWVESTGEGIAGEVAGTVAPAFIPGAGEVAEGLRFATGGADLVRLAEMARMPGVASKLSRAGEFIGPAGRGAAQGAYSSVMSQPITDPQDFVNSLGTGAVLGGALGKVRAPREGATYMGKGRGFETTQAVELGKDEFPPFIGTAGKPVTDFHPVAIGPKLPPKPRGPGGLPKPRSSYAGVGQEHVSSTRLPSGVTAEEHLGESAGTTAAHLAGHAMMPGPAGFATAHGLAAMLRYMRRLPEKTMEKIIRKISPSTAGKASSLYSRDLSPQLDALVSQFLEAGGDVAGQYLPPGYRLQTIQDHRSDDD